MNFATLQGLTIPEGVVTQITDASGRVLWSAMEKVNPYIRPTADVSNEFGVYPAGSSAYMCVGEEVADGNSTYIYTTKGSLVSNTNAVLVFSGKLPTDKTISAVNFVTVGRYTDGGGAYLQIPTDFVFDGIHYCANSVSYGEKHNSAEFTIASNPIVDAVWSDANNGWIAPTTPSTSTFPSALTEHIRQNGGEVSFEVPIRALGMSGTKNTFYVTQVYIEVIFAD